MVEFGIRVLAFSTGWLSRHKRVRAGSRGEASFSALSTCRHDLSVLRPPNIIIMLLLNSKNECARLAAKRIPDEHEQISDKTFSPLEPKFFTSGASNYLINDYSTAILAAALSKQVSETHLNRNRDDP